MSIESSKLEPARRETPRPDPPPPPDLSEEGTLADDGIDPEIQAGMAYLLRKNDELYRRLAE